MVDIRAVRYGIALQLCELYVMDFADMLYNIYQYLIIHETYINLDETLIHKIMENLLNLIQNYSSMLGTQIILKIYTDGSGLVIDYFTGDTLDEFDDIYELQDILESI